MKQDQYNNPYAFPRPASAEPHGNHTHPVPAQTGMRMHEAVALSAFQAIITGTWSNSEVNVSTERTVELAWQYADAFMAERTRRWDEVIQADATEDEAERDRVRDARYIVIEPYEFIYGGGVMTVRLAWDQRAMRLQRVQLAIGAGDDDNNDYADAFPPHFMDELTSDIADMDLVQQIVHGELSGEATDTLPDWAQQRKTE